MSRRAFARIALESNTARYTEYGNLSMEEEIQLVNDAATLVGEIGDDVTEADRLADVAQSLEDLAVIADGIEEATPAETQLIETVGDMAVAGTDVSGEEVVPAQESYVGRRVATEGFREKARNIWNTIKEYVKKIWGKIESFFHKLFGSIPRLIKNIESLEKKINDLTSLKDKDSGKIKVTSVTYLCRDHTAVKTGGELIAGLKDIQEAVNFCTKDHNKYSAKLAEDAADVLGNFDTKSYHTPIGNFISEATKVIKTAAALPGTSTISSNYAPDFDVSAGAQLLGNVRLIARVAKKGESDKEYLSKLDILRRSGVELGAASENDNKSNPDEVEFKTLTVTEMSSVLSAAKQILKDVEEFERGSDAKKLKTAKSKLESASEKALAKVSKIEESDDADEKASVPYFRAMANFNQTLAKHASTPSVQLANHAVSVCRTAVAMVEKSASQYK